MNAVGIQRTTNVNFWKVCSYIPVIGIFPGIYKARDLASKILASTDSVGPIEKGLGIQCIGRMHRPRHVARLIEERDEYTLATSVSALSGGVPLIVARFALGFFISNNLLFCGIGLILLAAKLISGYVANRKVIEELKNGPIPLIRRIY